MLIAITSIGKDLSSQLDKKFGRAKYIIVFDTKDSSYQTHDNKQNLNAQQGAGIQSAQNIIDLGAEVLITGNCGPKAFRVLNTANVKIYSSTNGTVNDSLASYFANKLTELNNANVEGHWS